MPLHIDFLLATGQAVTRIADIKKFTSAYLESAFDDGRQCCVMTTVQRLLQAHRCVDTPFDLTEYPGMCFVSFLVEKHVLKREGGGAAPPISSTEHAAV
jgi:hypothetical protein